MAAQLVYVVVIDDDNYFDISVFATRASACRHLEAYASANWNDFHTETNEGVRPTDPELLNSIFWLIEGNSGEASYSLEETAVQS